MRDYYVSTEANGKEQEELGRTGNARDIKRGVRELEILEALVSINIREGGR